jgi:hypothetical protein
MHLDRHRCKQWVLWLLAVVVLVAGSVRAEETGAAGGNDMQPWTLDQNNSQLGKDLLPEVILNRVKNGEYWYRVVPVDPEKFKQNYSKRFWEASEANDGKYDIDSATCGLKDVATGKMPPTARSAPSPPTWWWA